MKKVLLVDDSRTVRMICRRIVESLGAEAVEAEDGAVALRQLDAHPEIDTVLLDWNMPVMDGLTCLRQIRSSTRTRQPRVVMCTTENDLAHIAAAIQAGADEYVMKPFTEDIVREKLEASCSL